ncbi:MAG: protein-glutamate O-methyltransferase CheR [Desulfobacteraceae bacterium]
MTIKVSEDEFNLLRKIILDKSGICLDDNKKYLIENRLSLTAARAGCTSFGQLARRLLNGPGAKALAEQVVEAMTTQETYWFRDSSPFEYLEDVFFPLMVDQLKSGKRKKIKVWSAASSTGQEACSIAMAGLDYQRGHRWEKKIETCLSILATDISQRAIDRAKSGVYTENEIKRGLSEEHLCRYFIRQNQGWMVKETVKEMTDFAVFNLQEPLPVQWKGFDLVMLRNVMIYFSDDFKRAVVEKIFQRMAPGGLLVLGSGETISDCSDKFQMLGYKNARLYVKKAKEKPGGK